MRGLGGFVQCLLSRPLTPTISPHTGRWVQIVRCLSTLNLDVGLFDDLAPAGDLGTDIAAEILAGQLDHF
jgi:hypothetical protein